MGEFARLAAPEVSARMSLYYFDLRSADSFSQDPDGIELPDVDAAHDVAVGALADALREAVMALSAICCRGSQRNRTCARSHGRIRFQNFKKQ